MANPYREILTTPGVKGLVIASSIARLPNAMMGIGIITMLVQQGHLYWLAGAVSGTFMLTNALLGPQVSKLVDQYGQSRVLPLVTTFSIGMLLLLVIAAYMKASTPLLFILAVLAGSMPSMPAMVRARWTKLFRGKPQLHTAFSLDTVLTEIVFIIGPPLAIILSTSAFAEAGPLAATSLLAIGVTVFIQQRQTEPKVVLAKHTRGKRESILQIPILRIIILALLAMGVIGGTTNVAVVAFANEQGWPTAASFILAAYALGSLVAGLTFGALRIALPIEKQFLFWIVVTAGTALLPILAPNVYIMAVMILISGCSFAPAMVIVMTLGTIVVPAARLTEGLTWMTTGISIGVALGGLLAGLVIDAYGARAGFGVAIASGLSMVVIAMMGLPILRAASEVRSELSAEAS